jgi:iron complex outermembrane receptor protein
MFHKPPLDPRSQPRAASRALDFRSHRLAMLASACIAAGWPTTGWSQTDSTVVITGNPLARTQGPQPASVLTGDDLLLRRAGSLGQTLDGLPGVSGTWFGPNASRPVIRGLDGDRLRLLENGGASVDASSLSFDHAVAGDPLVAERIEVLRGPAALLYGGNATGGVVNVIDNRIPRLPAAGLGGRVELRGGGAAGERAGALVLEGGAGPLVWHADAHSRRAEDLRVPLFTPVAEGEALEPARRVRNSAGRSEGGAVGASWVGSRGYLGAALETTRNRYGVTSEEDVTIDLKRDRLSLGGELRELDAWGGFLRQARVQASHSDYEHTEFEGPEVGTVFASTGRELRAEFRHAPLGALALEGVFGVQAESLDFSALGEEAFVPGTRTRSQAAFLMEEFKLGATTLSAGVRIERVRVSSVGDGSGAEELRFGDAASRRFTPRSLSLAAAWPLAAGWQLSGSLGHTERAPAYYELYANGLHIATAAFERGDPTLPAERSRHFEAGLNWQDGRGSHFTVSLFRTRFARYIALDPTGRQVEVEDHHHGEEEHEDEGGEHGDEALRSVPEYAFSAVRARLRGLEMDARWRVLASPWQLDFSAGLDLVRGENLDTGEPLPRLAPLRLTAGADLTWQGLRAGVTLRHAARQSRVPAFDRQTPAHTRLDLAFSGPLALGALGVAAGVGAVDARWFVRLDNVSDELAFNAGTIETLRALAPQPGRALSAGVRLRF